MIVNKWVEAAIKFHLHMHWHETHTGLELMAMTVMAENGGHKYRKLFKTANIDKAISCSVLILDNGGSLDCTTLLEETFWQFGWDPKLIPWRDIMRTKHHAASYVSYPSDWYGLKEWREGRYA